MGSKTGISWTDSTWNCWIGCHKVSQGCKNCYMFREQVQYGTDPNVVRRSKTTFNDPLKWKEPRRIFVCSWSDFFIEEADPWRNEAWDIIRRTPQHTYQILTKRPDRIWGHLPIDWNDNNGYPNVWLGVTAEDQENADKRIPLLLQTPARIRWVSYEPAIGPIDFEPYLQYPPLTDHYKMTWGLNEWRGLDWIVAGCESGDGARPMPLAWAKSVRDQCAEVGVPFFFKQFTFDTVLTKEPFLDGQQWLQFPK